VELAAWGFVSKRSAKIGTPWLKKLNWPSRTVKRRLMTNQNAG